MRKSVLNELKEKKLLSDSSIKELSNIGLEQLLMAKLELATITTKGHYFGFSILENLKYVTEYAILKHAISCCENTKELKRFLHISENKLISLLKKYDLTFC